MKKLLLFLKKIRAMQNDDRLIHWNRDKKNFRASPAYSELEERLELLESSRSSFSFLSTSVQWHIVCVIIVVRHYFHPFDIYQNQAGSSSPSFASVYHLLSSPRAKRAGPKGLRAVSARAVTDRRCPHSGEGEDFLTGQLNFFTKTAVTP